MDLIVGGLPRISIVVPSLNQGRWLAACLDSLVGQDYPDLEIIVMDGGSTDGSVEIIRSRDARIAHWRSGPDGGQAAAVNAGMALATGTVVGWLNADDLLLPGALRLVGGAASANPDAVLFVGRGRVLDEATGHDRPFSPHAQNLRRDALRRGILNLLQPATFMTRAAWARCGGLDPALSYCLDWDLFIRASGLGPAVMIDGELAVSREHDATKTRNGGLARVAEIQAMGRRHAGEGMTTGTLIALLDEALAGEGEDDLGPEGVRALMMARIAAGRTLWRLTGRSGGFPVSSDPGDRRYPAPLPPDRPERLRRGWWYGVRTRLQVMMVAAGLRDRRWLLARMRPTCWP